MFGKAWYYCNSYCFSYDFDLGEAKRYADMTYPKSYSSYGIKSVRMDYVHLLISSQSKLEVVRLTNGGIAIVTIENIDGLSTKVGCAVRFTDYSFLYIGGEKAVEINIITNTYTELPGVLNHKREYFGCDVVDMGGGETVIVAGGKGSEASKTSEYYDRSTQSWKLTGGNLIYPR